MPLATIPCDKLYVLFSLNIPEAADSVLQISSRWSWRYFASAAVRAVLLKPTQLQGPRFRTKRNILLPALRFVSSSTKVPCPDGKKHTILILHVPSEGPYDILVYAPFAAGLADILHWAP